jgi:hypothetical protein
MQDFLYGADAVAQAVKTNLLLLRGEWWEDLGEGLPLFQNILGQPGSPDNLKAVDLIVKDRILNTQGVASVDSFQSSYENRRYSISCTITTNTGQKAAVEVSW